MRPTLNLFDNSLNTFENVSMEMIDFQIQDEVFLKEFNSLTQRIVDHTVQNQVGYSNFITGRGNELYKELIVLLTERFGIPFSYINNESIDAACIPLIGGEYSVLSQQYRDDYLGELESIPSEALEKGERKLITELVQSSRKLASALKVKGILVDLKKAKIVGMPKDITYQIGFNFPKLILKYGVEARELAAIILHEVGHCFTHFYCCYREVINTTVLVDTFMENVENKNKSVKESLILAYEEATGDKELGKLKDKNAIVVATAISNRIYQLSKQNYAFTDSEQQADQFAARFGYGKDLTTGLSKIHKLMYRDLLYGGLIMTGIFAITLALLIKILCMSLVGFTGFIIVLLTQFIVIPVLAISAIFAYMLISSYLFPSNAVLGTNTYDEDKQRLERIALEIIKSIRLLDLDKKAKEKAISNVEAIRELIKKERSATITPYEWIVRKIYSSKLEMRDIEKITQSLMDNDLHLASAKLDINK